MCWSGEASTILAAAGLGATVYSYRKGDPPAFWMVLGFFTIMEVLQAASYPVIGQCQNPTNIWLTRFSYLHISLHPFAFNALGLAMLPADIRAKIQKPVYALCTVFAVYTLMQVVQFEGAGQCADHRAMCGTGFCTVPGNWHLAWEMPLNGWGNSMMYNDNLLLRTFPHGMVGYGLGVTVLPILYGAWRLTFFQFAIGPVLITFLTDNVDEQPAIWCLMAIGIAAIIILTPLQNLLRARRWFAWRWLRST